MVNLAYNRFETVKKRMMNPSARIVLWPRIPLSNSRLYTCEHSPPPARVSRTRRDSIRLSCFPCLRTDFWISPRDTANHHSASTLSTSPILSSNPLACLLFKRKIMAWWNSKMTLVGEFRKFSFSFFSSWMRSRFPLRFCCAEYFGYSFGIANIGNTIILVVLSPRTPVCFSSLDEVRPRWRGPRSTK